MTCYAAGKLKILMLTVTPPNAPEHAFMNIQDTHTLRVHAGTVLHGNTSSSRKTFNMLKKINPMAGNPDRDSLVFDYTLYAIYSLNIMNNYIQQHFQI